MSPLHINGFGGGVVLAGAPDTRAPDELSAADSVDIGPRGALIVTSAPTPYVDLLDAAAVPARWSGLYGLAGYIDANSEPVILAIGLGNFFDGISDVPTYLWRGVTRRNNPSPQGLAGLGGIFGYVVTPPPTPGAQGIAVTAAVFAGQFEVHLGANKSITVYLVCLGAREGFAPNTAPGLYVMTTYPGNDSVTQIAAFDALGTGPDGELPTGGGIPGTQSQQLYFRGVISYNDHVFGWGFDSADAANKNGPNRVMFSNQSNPLKWGNDNQGSVGSDRAFTDSDAITLGDAGEIIRGALVWGGKLFFGTDRGLHYIAGFGRDSFLTDGATPLAKAFNIVGPHAMIEGPDKLLYGVGDQGLWSFDGGTFAGIFRKLVDFAPHSVGWWDCLWTDPTRAAAAYPGRTNADLIWTAVDWERQQVLVGIPWCNATTGYGYGQDTVIIKYHPGTQGFTRQVFLGVQWTAAAYLRAQGQQPLVRTMGTPTAGQRTVAYYGFTNTAADAPPLPTPLPTVSVGPYAPFGPEGSGVVNRCYLTFAWTAPSSLPIQFQVTTEVDQSAIDDFQVFVQPTAPAGSSGDYWLDTSQTNLSIGNARATATVPARGGYLLHTYQTGGWQLIAGLGAKGQRITLPIPLTRVEGTRVGMTCRTVAASGRFQLEGFGMDPGAGSPES